MNNNIINTVLSTNDYSMFKIMQGNRNVKDIRKKRIAKSIDEVGLIPAPIVVNEKMEIIDGQGRFEVIREKGLAVPYIVIDGLGDKECIAMNTGTTNWTLDDYILHYSKLGNENYAELLRLHEKFPNIPTASIIPIAKGSSVNTNGKGNDNDVRDGSFTITTEISNIEYKLAFISAMLSAVGSKMSKTIAVPVCAYCYDIPEINHERLLAQVKIYGKNIEKSIKMEDAFDALSKIYNIRNRGREISFSVEWKNFIKKKHPGTYGMLSARFGL